MTGPGRRGPTLAERAAAERPVESVPERSAEGPVADAAPEPRPCWVAVTGAEGPRPWPGTVHAWRRAADGGWEGLVVAWLPSAAVRPRSSA